MLPSAAVHHVQPIGGGVVANNESVGALLPVAGLQEHTGLVADGRVDLGAFAGGDGHLGLAHAFLCALQIAGYAVAVGDIAGSSEHGGLPLLSG